MWDRKERKGLGGLHGGAEFLGDVLWSAVLEAAVCCFKAFADFNGINTPTVEISSCQFDVNWPTEFLEMSNRLTYAAGEMLAPAHYRGLHQWAERH